MTVTLAGDRGHARPSPPAPAAPSVTNSGTSSVAVTGTAAQVNALLRLRRDLVRSPTSTQRARHLRRCGGYPMAASTLTLSVDDNGDTGAGV